LRQALEQQLPGLVQVQLSPEVHLVVQGLER
jgi:hypothetical protein